MKKINKNSSTPFYQQLYHSILESIKNGTYRYGERIPSEKELCSMYEVSRIVVRKAISILQEEGYLIKKGGKGTFVAYPQIVESVHGGGSFTKSCKLIGVMPSTKIISTSVVSINSENNSELKKVFKGKHLIKIERIRLADETPTIYEIDYFIEDYKFLLNTDLVNYPMKEIIREGTGLIFEVFEDTFEIVYSNKEISGHLDVKIGMPIIKVFQKVLTQNNELVYVNEQYIRSDLYKYVVRYGG